MIDPILSTLEKIVTLYDGMAEASGDRELTVLLTKNIAKQLDLPEEVTLTTLADANASNSVFVTYSSELLERFSNLLNQGGGFSAIEVVYQGYLKTTGFEKQLLQALTPQNGLIHFLEAKPAPTRYLWCHVAYSAEADEKKIGMVSFLVNELTMVAPVEIGDALLWEDDRSMVTEMEPISPAPLLVQLIERTAADLIDVDLQNWQAKLNRAKTRDEDRLKNYYQTISAEINRRIVSRRLGGEEEAKELNRIAATDRELQTKLADLQSRYALKVSASLHSVLAIQLPTVHISCELVRKKQRRVVTAVWNPFTRIVEPLRCEESGQPVSIFYLDDSEAKIIAPHVWKH